jgi:hypothetical protein
MPCPQRPRLRLFSLFDNENDPGSRVGFSGLLV